jgi:hypothetical protein
MRLGWPQGRSGRDGEEKSLPLPGTETLLPSPQPYNRIADKIKFDADGFCDHGNEHFDFNKDGEFVYQMNICT